MCIEMTAFIELQPYAKYVDSLCGSYSKVCELGKKPLSLKCSVCPSLEQTPFRRILLHSDMHGLRQKTKCPKSMKTFM